MSRFMCKTKNLKDYIGYYVAQDVCDLNGRLLIKLNYKINEKIQQSLERFDICSIWISEKEVDKSSINVESRQVRTIEQRKKTLRNTFDEVRDNIISNTKRANKPSVLLNQETLRKVEDAVDSILESILRNPYVAVNLVPLENDADYLIKHSINVCYLGLCLLSSYKQVFNILRDPIKGLKRFQSKRVIHSPYDLNSFGVSCFLHDIAKVTMLDVINEERSYEEGDEEWEIIKKHPIIGHDMLFGKKVDAHALLGIKFHHENIDGTGYPLGVGGYKIHPYSRIIRIIDSFDAATTKRPGKEPKPFTDVLGEILAMSGSHYDSDFSNLFIDMMLCGKSGLVDD